MFTASNNYLPPNTNDNAQMIVETSDRRSSNNWEYLNENENEHNVIDCALALEPTHLKPAGTCILNTAPPHQQQQQLPLQPQQQQQTLFPQTTQTFFPQQQLQQPEPAENKHLFSLNHDNINFLQFHQQSAYSHSNNFHHQNNNNNNMPPRKPSHRRVVSDVTGSTGSYDFDFSSFQTSAFPPVAAPSPPGPPMADQMRMVSDVSDHSPTLNLPEPPPAPPAQQMPPQASSAAAGSSNDPIMNFLLNNDTSAADPKNIDLLQGEQLEQQQAPKRPNKGRRHRRVVSEGNAALFGGGPIGHDKHNPLLGDRGITDVMMELAQEPGPLTNKHQKRRSFSDDVEMKPAPTAAAPPTTSPSIMAAPPGPAIPEDAPLAAPLPTPAPTGGPGLSAIRALPDEGPLPAPRPAIQELPHPQDSFTEVSETITRAASAATANSAGPSPAVQENMKIQVQVSMANLQHTASNNVFSANMMNHAAAPSPLLSQQQLPGPPAAVSVQNAFAAAGVPAPTPFTTPAPAPAAAPASTTLTPSITALNDNFNYTDKSSMNKVQEDQEVWDHHIHTTDNMWLETLGNIEVDPLPSEEFIMEEKM